MIRITLLLSLFILFTGGIFSQPRPRADINGRVEADVIQTSRNSYQLYLSLRIPYDQLIFEKNDSVYVSGTEFSCEIYDGDKLIERQSVTQNVAVTGFNETLRRDAYVQNLISFKLNGSVFTVKPSLKRDNASIPMPIKEFTVDLANGDKKARPIVVENTGSIGNYILVNMGNTIPYDGKKYTLLVPVPDSLSQSKILIEQNGVQLKDTIINSIPNETCTIKQKEGEIEVSLIPGNGKTAGYIPVELPKSVDEGELQAVLEQNKKRTIYNISVVWHDKPFVLNDIDMAVNLLKVITNDNQIDYIYSHTSSERYKALKTVWARITKTDSVGYNPLMNEFYTRADYAIMNFSYNNQRNGIETDRGRVYLRFGKPTRIERNYNGKYGVVETWYYDNLKRKFDFEDTNGKGNFIIRQ